MTDVAPNAAQSPQSEPTPAQVDAAEQGLPTHDGEPHTAAGNGRLNWLRAGVLGANDGIVSVAGIVVGVAGATAQSGPIFTAGLAGLVAGAVSMALSEYVSVSRAVQGGQRVLPEQVFSSDIRAEVARLGTLSRWVSLYQALENACVK